jgi:DNA-binding IclR family transcriptional regulator
MIEQEVDDRAIFSAFGVRVMCRDRRTTVERNRIMPERAKNSVRTTEKTLRIVEALKENEGGHVTRLAEQLGMSKSTVHNHLATLEENGYVVKDGDTYRLGLKFLDLGGYTRSQMKLFRIAKPKVKQMAEETGEVANLLTEENGMGVYLFRAKGEQAVDLDTYVGHRTHLHYTAQGKAILAHMPESRVQEIIETYGLPKATPNTITDPDELFAELEKIRERGYATHEEERLMGLRSIAAPIQPDNGVACGSISISAPASRMEDEEITDIVASAANAIELNVKYS